MEFGINEIIPYILLVAFLRYAKNIEKKQYGFIYTPLTALGYPILFVITIAVILSPLINFKTISSGSLWLNLFGLFMFWLGGLFVSKIIPLNFNPNQKFYTSSKILKPKFFIFLFIFVILLSILLLRSILASRSLLQLEDGEYAQSGLSAHLGNFITIFIIILIGNLRLPILPISKIITCSLILICLVLKFCSSIKAELFLPIISGFALCVFWGKFNFSLKNILIVTVVSMFIFIGMALLFTIDNEREDALKYGLYYFIFYLTCGQIGFSEYVRLHPNFQNYNLDFLTTFYNNVIAKFDGVNSIHVYTDYMSTGWTRVSDSGCPFVFETNVYSLIGETYINSGIIIGSIFFILLGAWTYLIFRVSRFDIFLNVLYAYIYGCLFLSFFSSSYILLPSFVYVQIICVIFYVINKLQVGNGRRSISKCL